MTDSNVAVNKHQEITYCYQGVCPNTGEILQLPRTVESEAIARSLMKELEHSAHDHQEQIEGKMYGILLATSATGQIEILKAFSGLLNGASHIEGWVLPIAGREKVAMQESITLAQLAAIKQELIELSQIPERWQYATRSPEFASQFQALRDRHQISKQARHVKRSQLLLDSDLANPDLVKPEHFAIALQNLDRESRLEKMARRDFKCEREQVLQPLKEAIANADQRMSILKRQRRELSRTLQTQMHEAYVITNFAGETRSLRQVITEGAMPTGMGDCCAPKLLHYAATHDLTPLAMAEFWWGSPSPDGYKVQGEFYGACVERCQPLMGFLLSGRRSPPAPLKKGGEEKQVPLFKGGEEKQVPLFKGREDKQVPLVKGREDKQVPLVKGDLGGSLLSIIYEDEYLIAIAKPAGLLSVPGRYLDTQDSVLSRLRLNKNLAVYPVHRLDRQTSGVLLFARDLDSLRHLHKQFQNRQIHKIYEALLSGKIEGDRGIIDLPLWGNPENRPYQQVDFQHGKPSVTQFQLLGREGKHSRIEFIPLTGRTHQLRVHAADARGLGMPILGDRLYGCHQATSRLHLHARELCFAHPRSSEMIHLQIPVPF